MARRAFGTVRYRKDRKAWYVQFTHRGQKKQRRVGSTRREAARVLAAVQTKLESGEPLEEVMADVFGDVCGARMTFRQCAAEYLHHNLNRWSRTTQRTEISRLRGLCEAPFAGKPVGAVTRLDVTRWMSASRGQRSVATLNRYLQSLSCLFRWAKEMEFVRANPVDSLPRFSEKGRERTMWLAPDECEALLSAAPVGFRPLLLCALHTGLRRGELLALDWRSVDLAKREVVVEPENAKSGKVRRIRMSDRLHEELRRLHAVRPPLRLSGRDPVFLGARGGRVGETTIARWMKATKARSEGIEPDRLRRVSLHVLRHTFASHLAQQGVPMQYIALLLGHSTTYVTERYAHMAPDAGAGAIQVLERALDPSSGSRLGTA